jgi:hypothetical protein
MEGGILNLGKTRILAVVLLALIAVTGRPVFCGAQGDGLTPENTVILSNETDASFCRDFSVVLKQTSLEWIVLDSAEVPNSARGKNLILIGSPDAKYSGDLIRQVLTSSEADEARQGGHFSVLAKPSPWAAGRSVYVCAGADNLQTKRAAEEAIVSLTEASETPDTWVRPLFFSAPRSEAEEFIRRFQVTPEDEPLSVETLAIDVNAKAPRSISAARAAEDTERFFYLLSHGWGGYGFHTTRGDFGKAKEDILRELQARPTWAVKDLSVMLREHLSFISDTHMNVGGIRYGSHDDFWYDTTLQLWKETGAYHFLSEGVEYAILSVNGQSPPLFAFPSLNAEGLPIYRLGVLSQAAPEPLTVVAQNGQEQRALEIPLRRSDFDGFSSHVFAEDRIAGIPVIRVRSFGDSAAKELTQFIETAAKYRGEPYLIVDIRGNGGGNETWPVGWIARLTGRSAESIFIRSELKSETTLMGRANAMAYWMDRDPKTDSFRYEADAFRRQAEDMEAQSREPYWTGPTFPYPHRIPNDTTVVIVMNGGVYSAGEGFVMRGSRMENVVLVGENTGGALTFGNVSLHVLPNSKLEVWIPINYNFFADLEFREGRGLYPDLWVPAADAVNYAVAAIRNGTITTRVQLPEGYLEQRFAPESLLKEQFRGSLPLVAGLTVAAGVWAYFNRRKPRMVVSAGVIWLAFGTGAVLLKPDLPLGFPFLCASGVCLILGSYWLWRQKRAVQPQLSG